MSERVKSKWRPPLALVIGGTLAGVLALPVLGIAWFRLAGNILGWLETAQLFAVMGILATIVLAGLLWRLVLRPVWALTAHARAMKAGRVDTVPPQRFGTAEFGELGRSVIEMGDVLHSRARSLSAYADHVTHELKSPLTSLKGAAEMLHDEGLDPDDKARLLTTIDTSAARMEQLLNDLRSHAAARLETDPGVCDVFETVSRLALQGIEVVVHDSQTLPISEHDLSRVLVQLVGNSQAHGATRVDLTCGSASLHVRDNGPGVADGDRDRIFDPFFTTRRENGGTGMGLSIVRELIEAAGGRIRLEDGPGAQFLIQF
ncbi:MAG: HAMP domain-containing sensor histidine kinase [Aliishimia sp.]